MLRSSKHHFTNQFYFLSKRNQSRSIPRARRIPNGTSVLPSYKSDLFCNSKRSERVYVQSRYTCVKGKGEKRGKRGRFHIKEARCGCARKTYMSTRLPSHLVAPPRKIPRRRNGAVAISSDPVTSPAGGIDYFQERERVCVSPL